MDKYQTKREEIKQAGRKVIAAYGFYKTTLEDIASALGMRKNSLYHYFESKDALLKELIEEEAAIYLKRQDEITASSKPAKEKLIESCGTLIQFVFERAKKNSVTLSSFLEIQKVLYLSFPDFKARQRKHFQKILQEGIDNGEFKPLRTAEVADDIAVVMQSVEYSYYMNSEVQFIHEIDFKKLKKKVIRIITYIINGITIK